jgi:hypothetical protein
MGIGLGLGSRLIKIWFPMALPVPPGCISPKFFNFNTGVSSDSCPRANPDESPGCIESHVMTVSTFLTDLEYRADKSSTMIVSSIHLLSSLGTMPAETASIGAGSHERALRSGYTFT